MNMVALVTGGSRGIGLGIARQLANDGFDVAINGVRPESAVKDVVNMLRDEGIEAIYCHGDVGSSDDRKKIIQKVKDHYGALNILVNNAGIAPRERLDILAATEESFDEVMSINLKGNYFLTQAAANWMVDQKKQDAAFRACIVNVSSISATVASVNRGEYCISKAGISMATQLFAIRLGEFDIPVYEVRPGLISTDMTSGAKEKYDKMIEQGVCVTPRWGYPEDVGRVVGTLASGKFPYSTGQVIMVDGGLTLPRL